MRNKYIMGNMYFFIVLILALLLATFHCNKDESRVAKAFRDNNLTPNIVADAPENFIKVNYSNAIVDLGTTLNPLQTLLQPTISYEADDNELYTFMFFGPDLPIDLTPKYTQFLQWLLINIPGKNIEGADIISSYFPPVPYPGGLPYVFLVYIQNGRIEPDSLMYLSSILKRRGFDVTAFSDNNNLTGPIAGNFMRQAYLSLDFIKDLISTITSLPSLILQ